MPIFQYKEVCLSRSKITNRVQGENYFSLWTKIKSLRKKLLSHPVVKVYEISRIVSSNSETEIELTDI